MATLKNAELPLVTVIVPVYRVEPYLESCVNSLLMQTYSNIQVVLVNDGSPDRCPRLCDEFAGKYPNISVVHKENGGLSSARNAGIAAADKNTDYVIFLDSDDTMPAEAVRGLVETAIESCADIVIPDRYNKVYEDNNKVECAIHFPESEKVSDPKQFVLNALIAQGRAWRSTAVLYSYDLLIESSVRFPEGRLSEDFTFNTNLIPLAKKISFYPKSTLNNLKRKGSISSGYRENMDQDIWYIDDQAKSFLNKFYADNSDAKSKVDSLLCRNVVINIVSLMSSKNICFKDKVKKAKEILYNPKARLVWQKKNDVPYFQSKSKVIMMKIWYFLLRIKMVGVALVVIHLYSKIK